MKLMTFPQLVSSALIISLLAVAPSLWAANGKKIVQNNSIRLASGETLNESQELTYVEANTEAEFQTALEWLKNEEAKNPSKQGYVFQIGDDCELPSPAKFITKTHRCIALPKKEIKKLSDTVSEPKTRTEKVISAVTKYPWVLGIVRGAGVAGAISYSFITVGLDTSAAVTIGLTLGSASLLFQTFGKQYKNWVENHGLTYRTIRDWISPMFENLKDEQGNLLPVEARGTKLKKMSESLAYIAKFYGVEWAFLGSMYMFLEFHGMGVTFEGARDALGVSSADGTGSAFDYFEFASKVSLASALGLASQGLIEKIFMNKVNDEKAAGKSEIIADGKYLAKIFGLAVLTNSALALDSAASGGYAGTLTLYGMIAVGTGYMIKSNWQDVKKFVQKRAPKLAAAVSKLSQSCTQLLSTALYSAFPAPQLIPGVPISQMYQPR